jgi:DUF1680 family protein
MLNTEFGGMNEIFADLYADTGDERWLKLSYKFEHESFIEPLKEGQDNLAGKHGNTQVPKLIGSLDRYIYKGDESDLAAARFFWDRVARHHSFATGGHGKDEYFGQPDKLNDWIYDRTAETCNVYNMLKLTRTLFAVEPKPEYASFMERALFNHILGSIDPNDGSTCYMVPVGQGVYREYADMFRSFTCCVGSGMESHALHGDGIYYVGDDRMWINLYAPSTAAWAEAGVKVMMESDYPVGDAASIELTLESPKEFTLALRRPGWAGEGFNVEVNGDLVDDLPEAGEYVEISREWKSGDKIAVTLPKRLHLEPLPDNPRRVAVMWGPLALAAEVASGDEGQGEGRRRGRGRGRGGADAPVLVAADKPVVEWVIPVEGEDGKFRTAGVGRNPRRDGEADVTLEPFFSLHRKRYAAYWDLLTPGEWDVRAAAIAAERERQQKLQEATVAYFQPGEMQPERDFEYEGDQMEDMRVEGRAGRIGGGWFSFNIPVRPEEPMALVVTYHSGETRRRAPGSFTISVDGKELAAEELEFSNPPQFFDMTYPIPAEVVEGKEKVTVRFEAKPERLIGPVFGVRMIAAEPQG